jgi:hypothetical protein
VDDFVLNVKQIGQYPEVTAGQNDLFLLQQGGLGGPYACTTPAGLLVGLQPTGPFGVGVTPPANASGVQIFTGDVTLDLNGSLFWNVYQDTGFTKRLLGSGPAAAINNEPDSGINFLWAAGASSGTANEVDFGVPLLTIHPDGSELSSNTLSVARDPIAPLEVATMQFVVNNTVSSFNGQTGPFVLTTDDILRVGGAPIVNANFGGFNTSPTPWDFRAASDQIATTAWVQMVLGQFSCSSLVSSFNGRTGAVTLTVDDVNAAYAAAVAPDWPTAPNPVLGDASTRIATTMFVDESVEDLRNFILDQISGGINLPGYAPINSPNFTGIPTAPTANPGTTTGQLATTAFVQAAVVAATTGVASFNTRTGAVVFTAADLNSVGGALLASPHFTGTPLAPAPAPGTNTTQIATCAFVLSQIALGVASFNSRTGAVVLTSADVTGVGGALLASPTFTGIPAGPTATAGDNSTALATTAFVHNAVASIGGAVVSFNGRTGAVSLIAADVSAAGGALVASPTFTGVPAAPTASPGTNTTQLATTAYVTAAIAAGAGGVTSFNTRTGVVTLTTADVTGAGGAPIANPAFTGTPSGPTAAPGTNSTQFATTAFVAAAGGVTSFNTRTGAVSLSLADVTAAGGAPLASPTFTGTPAAPTVAQTDNSTTLATTAYVRAAITNAVSSFNSRTGAVTFLAADVSAVGGALLASPTFTGTPNVPTAAPGTNNTQAASTAFVGAAVGGIGGTVLPSMLAGLGLANNATTPATVLNIATGSACSDDNLTMMNLVTALTKNCNAAWAVGSGNGALDAGSTLTASRNYDVFLIERTDTGIVDVLISLSATPTLPTNYTKKRRIGAIVTDTLAHILAFRQAGSFFHIAAISIYGPNTATQANILVNCPGPVGAVFNPLLQISVYSANGQMTVTSADGSGTIGNSLAQNINFNTNNTGNLATIVGPETSAAAPSGQIMLGNTLSAGTGSAQVSSVGWFDSRGT